MNPPEWAHQGSLFYINGLHCQTYQCGFVQGNHVYIVNRFNPLLPTSEILSHRLSSVVVQSGLRWTWSETPQTGFLVTQLISK